MAGLYLHIPFCKTRCGYCDFHTSTATGHMDSLVDALCKEIKTNKAYLDGQTVDSIYFGGGTPSLLSEPLLTQIFETIFSELQVAPDAEITLEANPDDLSESKLRMLKALPINRLSIGIQSLNNNELKLMNRRHSAVQALNSVERAYRYGFYNLSIDLIYGIPNQSLTSWEKSLKGCLKLPVNHLSSYSLTYETGTPFTNMVQNKKIIPLEDETVLQQFRILLKMAEEAGFTQYEISNFCKPGFESRHNSSYWDGTIYWGIGPSAHSFNGISRQWNVADNVTYINALQTNRRCYEAEPLDNNTRYNEYVITHLRTMNGCDLFEIECTFGIGMLKHFLEAANGYLNSRTLQKNGNTITLTQDGIFISDRIMSDLLIV